MRLLFLLSFFLLSIAGRGDDSLTDPGKGTAITVIFDNSGSMEGDKLTQAKGAFQAWLAKTPPDYTWSLIDFEEGGKLVIPFGKDVRQPIADAIAGFKADTNTPIVNSLKIAQAQILDRRAKVTPYERHLVLLFTDGEENQDPGGDVEVINVIKKMREANIEVVGIGYHGDGDYLAEGATHYYQADNADALQAGLDKVDAEVDMGGEVKMTPEDLAAMSTLPPGSAIPGQVPLEGGTSLHIPFYIILGISAMVVLAIFGIILVLVAFSKTK